MGLLGSSEGRATSLALTERGALSPAVGKILTLNGPATIVRADGSAVPVEAGAPLYPGDAIETGDDGQLGIMLEDGTTFNLSNNSRIALAEFGYDSGKALHSALVRVSQGRFAFRAGKAATRGGVSIDTPFATLRSSAMSGALVTLTLAAVTVALLQKLEAASNEPILLDDLIKYKDLEHGTLGIVPKGGERRLIILDDPEMTIIIGPPETGYTVQEILNSSAVMSFLLGVSQEANAIYLLGQADPFTTGSIPGQRADSGIIFFPDTSVRPANFFQPLPALSDDAPPGDNSPNPPPANVPPQTLVLTLNENLVVEHDQSLELQVDPGDDTDAPFPIDLGDLDGFDPDLVIGQASDGGEPGDDPFVSTAGSSGPVRIAVEPSSNGVYSGLDVTGGGRILLFKEFTDGQQVVVGREEGTNKIAFIIFVTPNGQALWVQELLPIDHGDDGNDPDSTLPIDNDALLVRGTLIGTSLTQTAPIGNHVAFVDDAPVAVDDAPRQLTEDAAAISGNVIDPDTGDTDEAGEDDPGTDGATLTHVKLPGSDEFVEITDGNETSPGSGVWQFTVTGIGTYTFQANGDWTFDPALNQSGHPVNASFTYRLTDGDGDFDDATQPISVLDGADPTGGQLGLTVEERDLDTNGSTPGDTGESVSGLLTITAGSDDVTNIAFGDTSGISVQGLLGSATITWLGEGTDTLVGQFTPGVDAIRLQLTDPGTIAAEQTDSVTVVATLLEDFPHALLGADSVLIGGIQVKASEADGDFGIGHVRVRVLDDVPTAGAVTENLVETTGADANVLLIFDVSGSMGNSSGVTNLSRLDLAKAAANELLEQYENQGDVRVQIITFSDTAAKQGNVWLTVDAAKAFISGLSASGGSDYDDATALAPDAFDDNGKLTTPGVRNVSYFFSDNSPTSGDALSASDVTNWTTFLNENDILSVALGIGTGVGTGQLNPIAYDGRGAGSEANAVIVTHPSQLQALPSPSTLQPESGTLVPPGSFGADGGFVKSITIDGTTTYTYDPAANGGQGGITSSGAFSFETATNTLTVTLASLATFAIDMDDGSYTYTPPPSVNSDLNEQIGFTLSDGDFDTASNTLTITVTDAQLPPMARDDLVITNIAAQPGMDQIVIPEFALLYNDVDPNGQAITITDVNNATNGSGTAAQTPAGSVTFTENSNSSTNGGIFFYEASTTAPAGTDSALVVVDRGQVNQSTLDGTGLGDILIGRTNAADTILGFAGNDVLIGGNTDILTTTVPVVIHISADGGSDDDNDDYLEFRFASGIAGVDFVKNISINLRGGSDTNAAFDPNGGDDGSDNQDWGPNYSNEDNIDADDDITASFTNGNGTMTLTFDPGTFGVGDGFDLNIDVDSLGSDGGGSDANSGEEFEDSGVTASIELEDGRTMTGQVFVDGPGNIDARVTFTFDGVAVPAIDDILDGGAGDDLLWGQGGNDVLIGGTGSDKYLFQPGEGGIDEIALFEATEEILVDVANLSLTALTAVGIDADDFASGNDTSAGFNGSGKEFFFEADANTLWYSPTGLDADKLALATISSGVDPNASDIKIF